MRARGLLAATFWLLGAGFVAAIPYIPPPQPIYEAPIDRALENVAAMEGVPAAQREQLLGRLNLLAYARNDPQFAYLRTDNRLITAGSVLCAEVQASPFGFRGADAKPQAFAADERCAAHDFQLGPEAEIMEPGAPPDPSVAARARLTAAGRHYAEAVRLEPENLRARLGYAYVLDRQRRLGAARRQLREIIARGAPLLNGPGADWETHAVLTEAATHLEHLARARRDKAQIAMLRTRLAGSEPIRYVTPIVAPLVDAPFSGLIDNASPVAFDFAGTGDKGAQGWLTPDAAWLVWDPAWRGDIRSGFDLIGQRAWSVFWRDGFEALRALDDDRDGALTGAELGGLSLWRDDDSDGVSDPGEVIPVQVHGVVALDVNARRARPGLLVAPAGIRFDDGRTRALYDWTPGLTGGEAVS